MMCNPFRIVFNLQLHCHNLCLYFTVLHILGKIKSLSEMIIFAVYYSNDDLSMNILYIIKTCYGFKKNFFYNFSYTFYFILQRYIVHYI